MGLGSPRRVHMEREVDGATLPMPKERSGKACTAPAMAGGDGGSPTLVARALEGTVLHGRRLGRTRGSSRAHQGEEQRQRWLGSIG